MKLNLTIKRMLMGLVVTGVGVILVLAAASFYSNNQLIESQARLTEIVLPLETANQEIRVAMANFIERQGQIMGSNTLKELDSLAKRTHLETVFQKSLQQLQALAANRAEADGRMKRLSEIYAHFLKQDSEMLATVRRRHELDEAIDAQLAVMDHLGAELQKNGETIYGRVTFAAMREKIAFREYLKTTDRTDELRSAVSELAQGDLSPTQKACNDLRLGVASMGTYGRQILLFKDKASVESILTEQIAKAVDKVTTAIATMKKGLAESPELLAMVEKIESDFNSLNTTVSEVSQLRVSWITEKQRMEVLQTELKDQIAAITDSLEGLRAMADDIRKAAEAEALRVRRLTASVTGILGVLAIVFMIFIGLVISRRIMGPIDLAVAFADTISAGDLTARIQMGGNGFWGRIGSERNDEISNLIFKLSNMVKNLNDLIGQVQQSGIQVTASATELSATSKHQKSVINKQVESTHYVVKSVNEISNVSTELVNTMRQVAAMSEETAEFASSGQEDLLRMKDAIHNMEDASRSISGKLENINEKATNITSVVTTITKVADQTNLLSLNAAIEAEKAGEYGRGFTVVAREIRRLADQTAVATFDIERMVQDMQSAVSKGVMEMEAFIKEVQRSAEDVGRISSQLTRIIEQVKSLSPSFDAVNQSMQFQSEQALEINNAMEKLGKEMTQTMESLKESFLAIDQLNDAARVLQDEVSRFKVS